MARIPKETQCGRGSGRSRDAPPPNSPVINYDQTLSNAKPVPRLCQDRVDCKLKLNHHGTRHLRHAKGGDTNRPAFIRPAPLCGTDQRLGALIKRPKDTARSRLIALVRVTPTA